MTPQQINQTLCKAPACRARIMWTVTAVNRAKMPLDVEALPLGQALDDERNIYYLDEHGRAVVWSSAIVRDVGSLHRSHWATCLDRDRFKR